MLDTSSPQPLYRIDECPDLMVDGCIADETSSLVFLSAWARDTAIQEFIARLTLGRQEQGLEQFHLMPAQGASIPIIVGNVDHLEKRSTRAFRRTLFGSLVHLWLIDTRCITPDKANGKAFALLPKAADDQTDRLWALMRETCPLPLLDHWRGPVLELLHAHAMLGRLPFAFGPLAGYRLDLDVAVLTTTLGELIRQGRLDAVVPEKSSGTPLRRAA